MTSDVSLLHPWSLDVADTSIHGKGFDDMESGKNPTRKQKIAIQGMGLVASNWLVLKIDHKYNRIHIMHRNTGTIKVIPA